MVSKTNLCITSIICFVCVILIIKFEFAVWSMTTEFDQYTRVWALEKIMDRGSTLWELEKQR